MQWIFNAGSQLVLITFILRGLKFLIDTMDKSNQEIAWWVCGSVIVLAVLAPFVSSCMKLYQRVPTIGSMPNVSAFTAPMLYQLALFQRRWMIWLLVMALPSILILTNTEAGLVSAVPMAFLLQPMPAYQLVRRLRMPPGAWAIFLILPVVGPILLVSLDLLAVRILKNHGYQAGFLGVNNKVVMALSQLAAESKS